VAPDTATRRAGAPVIRDIGNATVSTIDATFDGIDCDDGSGVRVPFSGRILVTK